jgi:hypothetical protein
MPHLARVLTDEDMKRAAPGSHVDLSPYLAIVDEVAGGGVGGLASPAETARPSAQAPTMALVRPRGGSGCSCRSGTTPPSVAPTGTGHYNRARCLRPGVARAARHRPRRRSTLAG